MNLSRKRTGLLSLSSEEYRRNVCGHLAYEVQHETRTDWQIILLGMGNRMAGEPDFPGKDGRMNRYASFTAACIAILLTVLAMGGCSSGGGGGATTGTVTGTVKNIATGNGIAGALVSDGTVTAQTDAQGAYSLIQPAGPRILQITAVGYEPSSRQIEVAAGGAVSLDMNLTEAHADYWDYGTAQPSDTLVPAASMDYVILAWNDLGMHCAQDDYSSFLILPPFNTIHAQVMKRGEGLVTSGITVSYAFPKKTNSAAHTNFWDYAAKYGWNVAPNIGITGTPLSGAMALDAAGLGYMATGIPVTPYDDDGTCDPYGTAVITVTDTATGAVLQTAEVVVPVSTELNCSNCHGTTDAFLNILQAHDKRSGTTLVADRAAGTLHICAECHGDNALGLAGKTGIKNLSQAMHGFHKDKQSFASDASIPTCYNCHPGPKTQCFRGQMEHAGMVCKDCHGDLDGMAAALDAGRNPWLEEPRCGACHGSQYAENENTLYRNSVLKNSPDDMNVPSKMDGKLYCEACHNSTHAEFPSTNAADNGIPQKFQGDSYWIWNCYVCHTDYMPAPSMHRK